MICCKNDIGETAHNKDFDTGIEVNQTGMHELLLTGVNHTRFTKYYHFTAGENIIIPAGILNEDFTYKMIVTQPDGSELLINECPNFVFRTYINKVDCDDISYL
jgi:hypothetical protein